MALSERAVSDAGSAPANVAAHISGSYEAFRDTYSKACLSRRSAVVRGAVDTGCRRNNIVAVCLDGELKCESMEEA